VGIRPRLDESDRDKFGVGASMYPATGTAPRKRPSPEDDPSHAGRSAHTGSASAPNRNSEVRISASARCCQCSWRPKSWMCPNARPVALCTAVGTLRGRGRLVHDGALSPAATSRTKVMRSNAVLCAGTRCARLVALWLHCVATGCASLQHGIRRCTMPPHRRKAHSRGTPWRDAKGYAKGYASPNGRGTSLAVVGRADHVGLVRRTRRLGLRTASPRAPSASRRRRRRA